MNLLPLHEFHRGLGAKFLDVNGQEAVTDYGNPAAEYGALTQSTVILDCSYRARICLLGADRIKFLNGQVTNNVKDLKVGEGCYAALVSAKGKIQSDLHVYILENELLIEFEPGLTETVQQRLEKFVIAEDVQVVDVAAHYGLWSVQGPDAAAVIRKLPWAFVLPEKPETLTKFTAAEGEIYIINRPRTGTDGFDVFVPTAAMEAFAEKARATGTQFCGWQALETARIEAGIPRFGADMDETNLAPEVVGANAISYSKGCYIGQEVIARVRTYGQVAKALRGLRLPDTLNAQPVKGDKLFLGDKEVGYITSATASPRLNANIALGCVRREANEIGKEITLRLASETVPVKIVPLPFA